MRNLLGQIVNRLADYLYGTVDLTAPLGQRGEQAACRLLRRKGYRIVSLNDKSGLGEIDIVAVHRRTVVFVEVKTRSTHAKGHPADHVDGQKQERLTRAALSFLKRHRLLEHQARFDVIAIWWPRDADAPDRIEHFENAFEATGSYQWFR